MEILVALFGILILALVLGGVIAGYAIVDGIVISILWNWFAVPLFHLNPLTLVPAMGLSLLVQAFQKPLAVATTTTTDKKGETKRQIATASSPLIRGLVLILLGYVVHRFM